MEDRCKIKNLIREYAGSEFLFLAEFMDGGYESYVLANIDRFTKKKVFGIDRIRSEYRNMTQFEIEHRLLNDCENTIEYVKNHL